MSEPKPRAEPTESSAAARITALEADKAALIAENSNLRALIGDYEMRLKGYLTEGT